MSRTGTPGFAVPKAANTAFTRILLLPVLLVASIILDACACFGPPSAADWVSLGTPSSGAAHIAAARGRTVWVESKAGAISTTTVAASCVSGPLCSHWQPAATPPDESELGSLQWRGSDCSELDKYRATANPPGHVIECVLAILPAGETYSYYYFALMSDGSVTFLDDNYRSCVPWVFTGP